MQKTTFQTKENNEGFCCKKEMCVKIKELWLVLQMLSKMLDFKILTSVKFYIYIKCVWSNFPQHLTSLSVGSPKIKHCTLLYLYLYFTFRSHTFSTPSSVILQISRLCAYQTFHSNSDQLVRMLGFVHVTLSVLNSVSVTVNWFEERTQITIWLRSLTDWDWSW